MDPQLFVSNSPGTLVRIPRDAVTGNEHAFMPQPLPGSWEFPVSEWPLLAEAKRQLGILEGIGRTLPNPGILLRPLEDRESITSSRLEGTFVTAGEFLLFEMQPREAKSDDDPTNDRIEVFNYRKALHEGLNSELPLSLRLLRDLHRTLLTGVRGRDRTPGEFRRGQVAIGSSHRFVPPPPEKVMECLDLLERYFHATEITYDPLVNCFLIHYQFESIHPFNDGNGRVGRLLLAIMLKQCCELSKPWLYMSDYFERQREEYIQRLFDVSARGDWTGWIRFCLQGTVSQAKATIQRCEKLLKIREEFMKRVGEVGGSVRLNQIVENVFYSPFVRVADLPAQLSITYPTAKADVDRLVQAGILRELPNVNPKTFYAPEVFSVAYDKME